MSEAMGFRKAATGLDALANNLGIEVDADKRHSALYDAWLTAKVYLKL